jgi:hypothetical protein
MGFRIYMYHAELAPQGQVFDSDELASLPTDWVDTPAKFDAMSDQFDDMDKVALEAYARAHFNLDIDRRRTATSLRAQLRALEASK